MPPLIPASGALESIEANDLAEEDAITEVYEPLEAVAPGAAEVLVEAFVPVEAVIPVEASAKPWVRVIIATKIVACSSEGR